MSLYILPMVLEPDHLFQNNLISMPQEVQQSVDEDLSAY